MLRVWFRSVAICGLAACGDATGVGQLPNIEGTWSYYSRWSVSGVFQCHYNPSSLTIDQTGATFTGRLVTPELICSLRGGLDESLGQDPSRAVLNGTINAAEEVIFDIDDEDRHHTGSVTGNYMSGTLRFTGDPFESGNAFTSEGFWSLRR